VGLPAESAIEEITRLRNRLNDLLPVLAHPELWANGAPPPRVTELLDGLPEMLERIGHPANPVTELIHALRPEAAESAWPANTLREDERLSRVLMNSIPGLFALLKVNGEVDYVNREIVDYTGRSLDELRQWGTNDIVHPEDLPHVIEVFTRSVASSSPYEILERLRRADGVYRWFRSKAFPLRGPDGRMFRWCVLLNDIDEQKRAEDAVRASQRNLQLIVDTIPGPAWAAESDGSVEFFNRHYLDFIGFAPEQASGWGWTTAIHPDDMDSIVAKWQQLLVAKTPGEHEARLRRHDGAYRWFLFRANPLRNESGDIVKWYGVNTDIDDLKRAQTELQRAYDHLAQAQRLSQTGSFTSDLGTDEHYWSEEFYRICEFEPGSTISIQRLGAIVHPEDVPLYEGAIQRALSGAEPEFYFRIVTATGVMKHLRGFARRITDRPVFVGAVQDVTATRVAEDALNKARSELAHVARVTTLNTLTASIAHEINQPLSGILTNAETCLMMLDASPPDVEGARETANRTIRDGHRTSAVVTRLRALFSKREFMPEPLDLNEATREVMALSASDLQRNRVAVQAELAEDLPTIIGDRIQLQQVILNLLRNASDAMTDVHDRPRQLMVRTEHEDGDRVRVTVRDAGTGFERQSSDRLFEAFYTTKSNGMGIGLSVSRSIVERHHGRLWAEPNDGPGATFAFSIPRDPASVTASSVVEH
jgi:PAS domain S-box-containing protein